MLTAIYMVFGRHNIKIMKKLLAFLLVLVMVFTGFSCTFSSQSTIKFGTQNGKPISWYVVFDEGDKQILMSEYLLDTMPYNDNNDKVDWGDTTLHEYLNTDFVNEHFSKEERERMLYTNDVDNDVVTMPSINNLLDIYGKLNYMPDGFYNAKDFFAANKKIIAKPSEQALYNEIEVFDNATFAEIMQQDVDKRYDFANGHSAYWLLNKTEDKQNVYYVTSAGYITYAEPNTEYIGIRPMIRIKK